MRIARKNKYRVAPKAARTFGNITFASKAEMQRYVELKLLHDFGDVVSLTLQPRFHLGCPENTYIADFRVRQEDGAEWVEDVKGFKTQKFRRDMKLWRRYGDVPLRVLTRRGTKWSVEIIEPESSSHEKQKRGTRRVRGQ